MSKFIVNICKTNNENKKSCSAEVIGKEELEELIRNQYQVKEIYKEIETEGEAKSINKENKTKRIRFVQRKFRILLLLLVIAIALVFIYDKRNGIIGETMMYCQLLSILLVIFLNTSLGYNRITRLKKYKQGDYYKFN